MTLKHLAVIPDGNRRWAQREGLSNLEGHRRGYDHMRRVAEWVFDRGIEIMTIWAFSTDNWKRSKQEVQYLMNLFERALLKDIKAYQKRGIRLKIIGRSAGLKPSLLAAIEEAETKTHTNTRATLAIGFNYGGRDEIIDAVRSIVEEDTPAESINEDLIRARLYWPEMPPPDLIIRTSGEERLSGFLLWESVFSEIVWCSNFWPDFTQSDLDAALESFVSRKRRFGGDAKTEEHPNVPLPLL